MAAAELGRGLLPVQAAVDHEVQDQPQIVLEADRDPLAEAAQPADLLALRRGDRRLHGAQQERARQTHTLKRLILDALLQRLDVEGDVGQLGHDREMSHARAILPSLGRVCDRPPVA
jgi:hypothetical protein